MSNKDGYAFWCSSCKHDHAGECAKPGEASGKAMEAMEHAMASGSSPWGYPSWLPFYFYACSGPGCDACKKHSNGT